MLIQKSSHPKKNRAAVIRHVYVMDDAENAKQIWRISNDKETAWKKNHQTEICCFRGLLWWSKNNTYKCSKIEFDTLISIP